MRRAFYTVSPQGDRLAPAPSSPSIEESLARWKTRARARTRKRAEGEVGNAMRTFDMNGPADSRHRYRYRGSDVGRNRAARARTRETCVVIARSCPVDVSIGIS